jgi:hypothetical protein
MLVAYVRRAPLLLLVLGWLAACAPLISEYNADAYKNATTLKAETLSLIDKAGDSYGSRRIEAEALTTKVDAAYEFAAGLPNNQISAQQWQILRNPDGNLYGGFVRLWRKAGKLGDVYRSEKKAQLAAAFDYIICLEANKKDSKSCSSIATGGQ